MVKNNENNSHLQVMNEELYKHSVELVIVNKTLSLLRKLYQVSLLSLEPNLVSSKVTDIIMHDLNMEAVGIFLVSKDKKTLNMLGSANSERFAGELAKANFDDKKHSSLEIERDKNLNSIINENKSQVLAGFSEIFPDVKYNFEHVKSVLLYPLATQNNTIGMLSLISNRAYDSLSTFETESISSLVDVVAVALDKALIYQELQDANEQLKALDKARAEFISIASHQLRTPPATIKWYLGAVLAGDFGGLSDELKSALERANVTNEAQISTIDDLLNASRIERGKLEFFFEAANMEPIVSALVMQLQPLAEMKKQHIVYEKPKMPIPDILMDREKIRQVINNMIDNAIKYSKTGDIRVTLEADSENITVKIIDTGKGIDPADAPKLFQKYQRGSDSATHATGLGLGMYVAKIVVEQNQGKIWAESEGLGKGSTFAFSLPIKSDLKPTTIDLAAEEHK